MGMRGDPALAVEVLPASVALDRLVGADIEEAERSEA